MKEIKPVQHYLEVIRNEHANFLDDGLSGGFPDWLYYRFRLGLAGRVHDWHYCSRCHPQGTMNQAARRFADRALIAHARELLPWWLPLAPIILYLGVRLGGGTSAWNSCGSTRGDRCRHNITQPVWMQALGGA